MDEILFRILTLARWASSGDNVQPWRFEILSDRHVVVHGMDTRKNVVYDRCGSASQMASGILLETIRIAASGFGLRSSFSSNTNDPENEHPLYDVRFEPSRIEEDILFPFIEKRFVNRLPMRTSPLKNEEKSFLMNESITSDQGRYEIVWLESLSEKLSMMEICRLSGKIRLESPKAHSVHRDTIDWGSSVSFDKIPDQSLGISPFLLPMVRWAMAEKRRTDWLNRIPGGTFFPRFQTDIFPSVACAAHFVILASHPRRTLMDQIDAGRSVCRFWLAATSLGLHIQPEMAPVIFRSYCLAGEPFSDDSGLFDMAKKLSVLMDRLIGREDRPDILFMGRIGRGKAPSSRAHRLPLRDLLWKGDPTFPQDILSRKQLI